MMPLPFPKNPANNEAGKPRTFQPETQRSFAVTLFTRFWPVVVPVLIASLYFGLIASDRYVATTSFVVRGADSAPKTDMMGILTGTNAQSVEQAMILRSYLLSSDLLSDLRVEMPLEDMFRNDKADVFSRLAKSPSLEKLQNYWQRRVTVEIEKTTGLVTLSVSTFRPEDSLKLSQAILVAGEKRLNDMSARSRADSLKVAEEDLAQSIQKLNAARQKLSDFRIKHNIIDPEHMAESRQGIADKMEQELVAKTVERANLASYMSPSAPQIVVLDKNIANLRRMISSETSKSLQALMAQDDPATAQALMDEYNQLVIDRDVAEKAYLAGAAMLEASRIDALRQRQYLAVFTEPRLPEIATEPQRLQGVAVVFALALLVWGIYQLIIATIKEHRQWNL
jgi:capsular polysaccharide transport system permease protein